MRLFINEFEEALKEVSVHENFERTVSIATGKLTYPTLKMFAERLEAVVPGLRVNVFAIRNDFFGETITVSGLVTGQDLISQLKEQKQQGAALGEALLIPSNMLRTGEHVFLDDITTEDVERELDLSVVPTAQSGKDFVEAVLNSSYSYERKNENFVYIQAYD